MATLALDFREAGRDLLVRVAGWRALIHQQDIPAYQRWRWLEGQLGRGPLRTLDAGCGSGAFTIGAARAGNLALGISLDPAALTRAGRRARLLGIDSARFLPADLRRAGELLSGLGTFDQILCLEVIEHLRDDQALLDALAGRLRPGGRLFLTTPYRRHRPLVGERLSPTEDGGHVRFGYDGSELRERLQTAGLKPVSVDYLSGMISQQLTNLGRLVSRITGERPAWLLTFPLRILLPLDRGLTRWTGYPPLAIALVAEKPR